MNIAVTYYSKTGNTKKVAQAIAEAAGCTARDIADFDASDTVDLLFIGGAIYGGKLDPALTEFISRLDPERIKQAVVFSTSASRKAFGVANNLMKDSLKKKGIPIEDDGFASKGKFLFLSRKHPDNADLNDAKQFALSLISK
ncbi:MAG: flavodoxin family protein [Bacillota bacterium]